MVRAGLLERASTGKFEFARILIVLAAIAALVQIVSLADFGPSCVGEPELALTLDGGNWKALMVQAEKALKEEKSEDAAQCPIGLACRSARRGSASGARHHRAKTRQSNAYSYRSR